MLSPAFYFPPASGRYEVAPGLSRFGTDFGNGQRDLQVFQFDADVHRYRAAKLAARREHFARHVITADLDPPITMRIVGFISRRLAAEHPESYDVQATGQRSTLRSALMNETLVLDDRSRLLEVQTPDQASPPYADTFDALASQVQEDLAIVTRDGAGHRLAAAHVCFPSGWAPEAMIGRDFAGLHHAVPGMEAMNARAGDFANLMVNATDGLVRFAWSVSFDDRLNHHPALPRTAFDPALPAAWLRVERQTIWGFPDVGVALFTIRTYLYDCESLCAKQHQGQQLIAALRSMSPASLAYKGLNGSMAELERWLRHWNGSTDLLKE
jgi:hypothetical protein